MKQYLKAEQRAIKASTEREIEEEEALLLDQENLFKEGNDMEIEEEINLVDELNQKHNELHEDFQKRFTSKGRKVTWLETLVVTSKNAIDQTLNTDDDIRRELFFYNNAIESAITGINKLKHLNEKINRPDDCFVEMLKSDQQMANVKREIIKEQQYIKKFEQKKQKMQNIKFAKNIKDSQNKEKAAFKKNTIEGIEKWKTHIKSNPDDYHNIDKFFDGKKKKKFNPKDLAGKSVRFKSRDKRVKDQKFYQKNHQSKKRPGKVSRINKRNKINSRKNK